MPGELSHEDLDRWFTYHPPRPGQPKTYEDLRAAGRELARTILEKTPPSADQTVAIRKVREAIQWANAAIACEQE